MTKSGKRTLGISLGVAACIIAAVICRNAGRILPGRSLSLLRSFIYIGLFMFWEISLRRRVLHPQTRRLMSAIACLITFWITVRTVKYMFAPEGTALFRWLWYSYYLPMLFIPLLSLFVAASIGKPEDYRLPRRRIFLYLPVALLFLLVMTNDCHRLVFVFPAGAVMTDNSYTYGPGYYAVVGCMIVCALTAVAVMLYKFRRCGSLRVAWLPLSFVFLAIVYAVLYIMYIDDHTSLLYYVAGDLTVSLCLLFSGTLEGCLFCGLIPTNTGYDALFRSASLGLLITDDDLNICYSSDAARTLTRDVMRDAAGGGVPQCGNTLVKASPINGGYIIWQEDVGELMRVRAELESTKEELCDRGDQLRYQYRQDAQRYRLEEQNRLYDLVQRETQRQLREIDALSHRFEEADSKETRRGLLFRILVLATYIKRRKDMVISADRNQTVSLRLLESALKESVGNLPLGGIGGNLYIPDADIPLTVRRSISAYDLFEDVLEASLDTLGYFYITVLRGADGTLNMTIDLECGGDLSETVGKYPSAGAEKSADGWFISCRLNEGGGAR